MGTVSYTHLGQTLGIIGATGSGKSTILQLLMRFYDADAGTIRIHGRDIRSYDPKELRKEYGIVMQNDFIFQDSVRENIAFGRPIDDELLDEATQIAQARPFIKSLIDEFDYKLNSKGCLLYTSFQYNKDAPKFLSFSQENRRRRN